MRLRAVAVAVVLGAAPAVATAIDGDILRARASLSLLHDSNLFRLPAGATLPGSPSRSDLVRTLTAGVDFERDWSAQVFRGSLGLRNSDYHRHPALDGTDFDIVAGWRWLHGDRNSVDVDLSRRRTTSSFADVRGVSTRPVVDATSLAVVGTIEFVPRWSAIAGAGRTRTSNSPSSRSTLDYRLDHVEAGARYDWRTGSTFDLVWRHQTAEFAGASGQADNGYRDDDLSVRLAWQATGATRVTGRAGLQSREYRDPARPSFVGPGIRLAADWRATGALQVNASLRNELSTAAEIDASYAQLRGVGVAARWQFTDKSAMTAGLDLLRRDFRGENIAAVRRRDSISGIAIGAVSRPLRWLEVGAELRYDRRNSNVDAFDFGVRGLLLRAAMVI